MADIQGLLDRGIASLYDRDTLVGLENEFGSRFGVENTATGPASDARHMAAMNELSKSFSPMNNPFGNFIGDTVAFGAGLINEIPALGRGFSKQNLGEIKEDIVANFRGSFGTPNTATARGIYEDVFSRTTPQMVREGPFTNYGAAQAATANNTGYNYGYDEPNTIQDLGFIDNAPRIKEAIGITDRGRGMTGPAVEMIGGQAVPVGDVLGRQMALEKADFVEETPQGLAALAQNFNPLAFAAGLINPAIGFAMNMGSRARSGLGSLGSKLADFREKTTGYRTQAEYDQARTERRQQARTDRMIDRISRGKKTRSDPRKA